MADAGFGDAVRAISEPFYESDASRGGRPGTDPEVYFKMLMIGFFVNLPSERAIAARCSDSLAIREFLHYRLDESTPDHSTLSIIRQRLSPAVNEGVFAPILKSLKKNTLLKGRRLGIDASVLEANASVRSLEHRLTGEAYGEYVKKLAEAAGVDPKDAAPVRRFDKKRPGRTTSNGDWQNPHDPDAKIGRTKRGHTPEHVVDLGSRCDRGRGCWLGDEHDAEDLAERVLAAEDRLNAAVGDPKTTKRVEFLAGDKGYFKVDELTVLHDLKIQTASATRSLIGVWTTLEH